MQMNSAFHEQQPIGVKNLSVALTRHHLVCTQDFQSDLNVLSDLTVTI